MSDLSAIITSNEMAYDCIDVETNPFMPHTKDGLKHYLCSFKGERIDNFEFYISVDDNVETMEPDAELALALLLEDVRLFRDCEGYEDFARMLGIDDDADDAALKVAYNEISRYAAFADSLSLSTTPTSQI